MGSARYRVSRLLVIAADCVSIALAQMLAYNFRFEFALSPKELNHLILGILLLVPFKVIVFYFFGLYRGMWRYTGLSDLQKLLRANFISSLILFSALLLLNRFVGLSRSVFLMDGVLCFLFTAGFRVIIRVHFANKNTDIKTTLKKVIGLKNSLPKGENTLLLGAGSAGEALIREIENNPALGIYPVGFLDDDPSKKGLALHGVPVLGGIENLGEIARKYQVEQIFLTMPSASAQEIRRVVKRCEETGLPYKTLPGIGNLIDGSASIKDLRDVNYEDLLGRPPVELDDEAIKKYIAGKTVLVTGGGGSIGSELCRQIIKFRPNLLIVLDKSEFNVFSIEAELRTNSYGVEVVGLMGRVHDKIFLDRIFKKYKPVIVFHAAAYKHVPLVERFPWEGVLNNVLGSKTVMEKAVEYQVKRFVLVSTDKAVRPTNVMGASKRVTELLARSMNGNGTKFMAVRFGNVVGSSGSVVPFFRNQIRAGGPVTVTHHDATRYFMTIPEASKLILQAGAIGEGGEIFVLKMGTPVRIMQMAEDLIRLSGKEPYEEIDITVTGLREGEKIYEELIIDDEGVDETTHKKIMVLRPSQNGNGHYGPDFFERKLPEKVAQLKKAAHSCDGEKIKSILKRIVPEYTPADTPSQFSKYLNH
ncbi:MAG: polysaccharide biosynthesis protein [Deltaproteobacteria bacterium]|nr:polysaccharide biosynthesis protein [Deltaproteobacteria bacterium]